MPVQFLLPVVLEWEKPKDQNHRWCNCTPFHHAVSFVLRGFRFSKSPKTLASSEILKIGNHVKQMIQHGEKVYNYTTGDFDPSVFPIPKQLEEEIVQAYREHLTNYPMAEGNPDLRQAIKRYIKEFQGLHYDENEILVASGGRPLIFALFLALCDPGDTIIYPVPCWNNNYYTHLVSGNAIIVETKEENKFVVQAEEIEPYIEKATLLALCSPQNPSGTLFTKIEMKKICDLVVRENKRREGRKNLYLLFDQLYSQLVHGDTKHYNPVDINPEIRPYTITVDAISKSFAATGIRVGWCLGPETLIHKMKVLLTHMGAWAPMPEQKGLARYLNQSGAITVFLNNFRLRLHERLQALYSGIMKLKKEGYPVDAILPEAAVFLCLKIELTGRENKDGTFIHDAEQLTRFLLAEAKIALLPFYIFGSHNNASWFRLSVGTCNTHEMSMVIRALRHALDHFKLVPEISKHDL